MIIQDNMPSGFETNFTEWREHRDKLRRNPFLQRRERHQDRRGKYRVPSFLNENRRKTCHGITGCFRHLA